MTRKEKIEMLHAISNGKATARGFEPKPVEVWHTSDRGVSWKCNSLDLTASAEQLAKRRAVTIRVIVTGPPFADCEADVDTVKQAY